MISSLTNKINTSCNMDTIIPNNRLSLLGRKWLWRNEMYHDHRSTKKMAQDHNLSPTLATLLKARDILAEDSPYKTPDSYLNPKLAHLCPDPYSLKGMEKACNRIKKAVLAQEKIAIFGDYDVDGTTSCTLLVLFLEDMYVSYNTNNIKEELIIPYIPDRIEEGYGPNKKAFQALKEQGVTLIISVDCGTLAHDPINFIQKSNIDVVVIDHHSLDRQDIHQETCPYALVNPKRFDDTSGLDYLAAVGVVFIFLVGLNRLLRQCNFYSTYSRKEPNLLTLLPIVALGTICDCVPLVYLNRVFVKHGLEIINNYPNIRHLNGLRILAKESGVTSNLDSYHLGFLLGPRINAGGRVGKIESGLGVKLLINNHQPIYQRKVAKRLNLLNKERQIIESEVLKQAQEQASSMQKNPALFLYCPTWHPGVVGIVASRLVEQCYKPCLVSCLETKTGLIKGSGRSINNFDLGSLMHEALQKNLIEKGGGHAMACGFTLHSKKRNDFEKFFIQRAYDAALSQNPTPPDLKIDSILSPLNFSISLLVELEKAGPYGQGQAEPRFILFSLTLIKAFIVGQSHISCLFRKDNHIIHAISFYGALGPLKIFLSKIGNEFHVVGRIKKNNWHNRENIQLNIEDAVEVTRE